jgi:RNA polymerase-binding transcription factor DksA
MTRSPSDDFEQRKARYRPILLHRQQQLQARLEKIEHDFENPCNRDDDDRAVERNNAEVLEALGETTQKELLAIKAALGRMMGGVFGICAKCGMPISDQRSTARRRPLHAILPVLRTFALTCKPPHACFGR